MSVLCRREFVAAAALVRGVEAGPTHDAPFMETATPPPAATGLPTGWPPLLAVAISTLWRSSLLIGTCHPSMQSLVLRPSCVRFVLVASSPLPL